MSFAMWHSNEVKTLRAKVDKAKSDMIGLMDIVNELQKVREDLHEQTIVSLNKEAKLKNDQYEHTIDGLKKEAEVKNDQYEQTIVGLKKEAEVKNDQYEQAIVGLKKEAKVKNDQYEQTSVGLKKEAEVKNDQYEQTIVGPKKDAGELKKADAEHHDKTTNNCRSVALDTNVYDKLNDRYYGGEDIGSLQHMFAYAVAYADFTTMQWVVDTKGVECVTGFKLSDHVWDYSGNAFNDFNLLSGLKWLNENGLRSLLLKSSTISLVSIYEYYSLKCLKWIDSTITRGECGQWESAMRSVNFSYHTDTKQWLRTRTSTTRRFQLEDEKAARVRERQAEKEARGRMDQTVAPVETLQERISRLATNLEKM
jgi:hypothetical protein